MLLRNLFVGATLISIAAGCGRGTYDKKVESAIERARNPPAEGAMNEAKGDAVNDDAAKDAAEGDAAKGDEAGKN
jgi:hypothetical protein